MQNTSMVLIFFVQLIALSTCHMKSGCFSSAQKLVIHGSILCLSGMQNFKGY